MACAAEPESLYHLICADDWNKALDGGIVPYGDRDRRDGFLHLSTESQVLETARRYFSRRTDMFALEIDFASIGRSVRFERVPERAEFFPHFYGELSVGAVRRARKLVWVGAGFHFDEGAA